MEQIDSTGEDARRSLMAEAIRCISEFGEPSFITFERRSGGQHARDLRTIKELQMVFGLQMRLKSPSKEIILWFADALASAGRRLLVKGDLSLIEAFRADVTVILNGRRSV